MTGLALIVASAAFVVLAAVAASGIGPAVSLRTAVRRFGALADELEALQSRIQRLADRAQQILAEHSPPEDDG